MDDSIPSECFTCVAKFGFDSVQQLQRITAWQKVYQGRDDLEYLGHNLLASFVPISGPLPVKVGHRTLAAISLAISPNYFVRKLKLIEELSVIRMLAVNCITIPMTVKKFSHVLHENNISHNVVVMSSLKSPIAEWKVEW